MPLPRGSMRLTRGAKMSQPEVTEAATVQASEGHASAAGQAGHHQGSIAALSIGAIGVVFGDIGTSPLYAFRETFAGHHPITADPMHITGVLSLVFWSMMIVVTFKYVLTRYLPIGARPAKAPRSEERRVGKEV